MVRLTEEMVVARTRISDLAAVKKLNCWGTALTDVSILRDLKKVEVLSLSVNNIDTLANFQYCLNLQDLFVRRNSIKDLNEVCYLQNLPNLRNLWLDENPCADQEGYRLAVLRTLPNLEKLDDKLVTNDEVQNALTRGRILVHPLDMDASPTRSDTPSPEDNIGTEYIADESELEQRRTRYNSSLDQYQQAGYSTRGHGTIQDYQENDRRNANWNSSPNFQHNYQQNNHYGYENVLNPNDKTSMDLMNSESRSIVDNYPPPTNTLGIFKEYDEQITGGESERSGRRRKHSSSLNCPEDAFEDNRRIFQYADNGENNETINNGQRAYADRQNETISSALSPRTPYPLTDYSDEQRRSTERRSGACPLESDQTTKKNAAAMIDRDEAAASIGRDREIAASQGWVRHTEKDKCRFHYHRRPVTRNSNILSAVLCLVKELDYPSLEVVEMAVRNRMDELEE